MPIAVTGCATSLPSEFPMEFPENAGNMVHANAPFEMFPNCIHSNDNWREYGHKDFATFVNKECSHIIFTLANTIRMGETDGTRYTRFKSFLNKFEKPIVIFGFGVQSPDFNIVEGAMCPEAVDLIKYISGRCDVFGVRGQFTADVFEKLCGVKNTFVTGCPSTFSRPKMLRKLHDTWRESTGNFCYAGTKYFDFKERRMLEGAIKSGAYMIEPVNKATHGVYLDVANNTFSEASVPYYLKGALKEKRLTVAEIENFFRSNYALFRNLPDWYKFNEEKVALTYGTRFHVNMASILSGKPAMWVRHDARTRELTDFLHLPAIELDVATNMAVEDLAGEVDFDPFFEHIDGLIGNFNKYLDASGLPNIPKVF